MLENLGMVKKMVKVLLPTLTEPPILVFSKTAKSMGKELLHVGIMAHNILVNLETEKNMEWGNITEGSAPSSNLRGNEVRVAHLESGFKNDGEGRQAFGYHGGCTVV